MFSSAANFHLLSEARGTNMSKASITSYFVSIASFSFYHNANKTTSTIIMLNTREGNKT